MLPLSADGEGFDNSVLYEFTEDTRYTMYSADGTFPTLEEFLEQNPGLSGHPWEYDGDVVVVDLHFGNFSRLIPNFKCGNQVIDWTEEDGSLRSETYYREGYDLAECDE